MRDVRLGLAVSAKPATQSLSDDECHRAGDIKRRNAHIHQARQCLRRIVGVQRGEHQVAGLSRFDGDTTGFQISDLTDHDDVRILTQE